MESSVKRLARCVACKMEEEGEEDFLCENCADPNKIFWICGMCGKKIELTETQLQEMYQNLNGAENFPVRKGITLVATSCPLCQPGVAEKITVHAIRGKHLN